ncbi:MAG: serine/threonine-protein kinase [Myxococcota bacterium]
MDFSTRPDDESPQLQRRITAVLASLFGLSTMFFIYVAIDGVVEDDWGRFESPETAIHAACSVVLLVLTVLAGRGRRTVRQLYVLEAVGILALGALMAWLSSYVHVGFRPEFTALMALTVTIVGRSAFVPSTPKRTVVLCLLLAIPLGWLAYTTYDGYERPAPDYPNLTGIGVLVYVMLWWLAVSALAVATSQVIYGLRRAMNRAMRLGQYALEEKIGEGGMGQVYRASHAMLRRPTAVKLLENASEEQLHRFEREVQLTAGLSHPNTIAIFDYGRTPEGIFYYAMEYLDGWNLEDLVRKHGPQPPGRVIHVLHQVCGALQEAHAAGLIHRDVKPANIILCTRGGVADVAKVLDFGLVKDLDRGASTEKTAHDRVLGTPLYMAPEAISAPDAVDGRSDLYALGAVGYFLLTGKPVFQGATIVEVCAHHLHSSVTPPSEHIPSVPSDLEELILQCLEKEPDARLEDADALREALLRCAAAPEWAQREARSWWESHGTSRPRESSGESSTVRLTVDVSRAVRAS